MTIARKHSLLPLILSATLFLLIPIGADAQWYLFPGGRNKEKSKTETPEEPNKEAKNTNEETSTEEEESLSGFESFWDGGHSTINITLALPIGAESGKANSNFLEMYGGALLAVRDLGNTGMDIRLKLIDCGNDNNDSILSALESDRNDIFIGPVGYQDMEEALSQCSKRDVLISPLEPKTAALALENENLIHAPVSWKHQLDELVRWIAEDLQSGEELIVVQDTSESGNGEQCSYLLSKLSESGLKYRSVGSVAELDRSKAHKYRILIASDSDSFLVGAARAAAINAARGANLTLYCTSRVRGNMNINDTDLYKASAHLTTAYFTDYNSEEVKNFVLSYRALFQGEPGAFAFHGYDLVNFFARIYSEHGRRWHTHLTDYYKRGLQSDFKFVENDCDGRVNIGVRRVVYSKDLSTTLLP